jgi:hypothetical protein
VCARALTRLPLACSTPHGLRGLLAAADSRRPAPIAAAPDAQPSASSGPLVSSVLGRSLKGEAVLRTRPEVLRALTEDVRAAKTEAELSAAVSALSSRAMSTGVYHRVQVGLRPSPTASGAMDVTVGLDEATLGLTTGATQSLSGKLMMGTEARLLNRLGFAETISFKMGHSAGEMDLASMTDLRATMTTMAATPPVAAAPPTPRAPLLERLQSFDPLASLRAFDPDFACEARFPLVAVGDVHVPLAMRVRRENEDFSLRSAFAVRSRDFEVSVSDPSNSHSLTYMWAARDARPTTRADGSAAASAAVVAQCTPSTKSSLAYSFVGSLPGLLRLAGRDVGGNAGGRVLGRLELAGGPLGGSTAFVKVGVQTNVAASFGRTTVDAGYAEPLPRTEWLEAQVARAEGRAHAVGAGKPQPGPLALIDALAPLLPPATHSNVQAEVVHGGNYTLWHRVAGWLTPGVTAQAEAICGLVAPLQGGADVRTLDRFHLMHPRLRGYAAVGPHAAPIPGGVCPGGDALGGDLMAGATARLLLPPPFPSVRLANAGLRSFLWASAGALGSPAALASPSSWAASAGAGVSLPITDSVAAEVDWALWHSNGPSSGGVAYKVRLSAVMM